MHDSEMCLQLGLRILRGAVWTAALTVSAVKTRHACYSTADAFVTAIAQLQGRYWPSRQNLHLDSKTASTKEKLESVCSVDVAAGGAGLLEGNRQPDASAPQP